MARKRKLKLFDKVLIVSGLSAVMAFGIFVLVMKRAPRHYLIPRGYTGWVTILYEHPEGTAPGEQDGAIVLKIPESGILKTTAELTTGWARDEHYWYDENGTELIPKAVEEGDDYLRYIHSDVEEGLYLKKILISLPETVDTTLWEGTRIDKKGERVDVRTGRNVRQHFFITPQPESFYFQHDSLPDKMKYW